MINLNLTTLNNEELINTAEKLLNTYEQERAAGVTYRTVQGKDLQQLEKALQRATFKGVMTGDLRPKAIHDTVKGILENDFGIREREKKAVKSLYEIERERNGWGRYNTR
jgi:hypothetical protein